MEGLIESARLANEPAWFAAARRTADALLEQYESRGFMPGDFDERWHTTSLYSCLTGDAQIAGVWLQIYGRTGEPRYLAAARRLNDYVKGTQRLRALNRGIRGGVKGSQPIWGRYTRFAYLNWAAKFLADSLMLEIRIASTGAAGPNPPALESELQSSR
jgi:hypothetical protein